MANYLRDDLKAIAKPTVIATAITLAVLGLGFLITIGAIRI